MEKENRYALQIMISYIIIADFYLNEIISKKPGEISLTKSCKTVEIKC